jgi:hypothetical protein
VIQLCGRYGIRVADAFDLTPGEFADLCSGAEDAEREQRYSAATIAAMVAGAFGGSKVSPEQLLGEVDGSEPVFGGDLLDQRARFLQVARANTERKRKAEVNAYVGGLSIDLGLDEE